MDAQAFALTMGRVMDEAKAGNETGAFSSMLKYYGTELNKRRAELAMSIAGSEGLKFDGQVQSDLAPVWLRTKANSIEGGTSGSAAEHHRQERAAAAGSLTMSLVLTEDQLMFRDAAKRFAAERAPVAQLRKLRDQNDGVGFDREVWSEMAHMGWAGVLVPKSTAEQGSATSVPD
jgi:alkylation response protein AidB-like acyl-CoA dehydrogenase